MKIVISILFPLLIVQSLYGLGEDKIKHFQISTLLGYGAETLLHKNKQMSDKDKVLYSSLGIAFSVGIAKEFYDEKDYGGFSIKDLVADFFGSVSGAILSNYLNKHYFLKVEHESDKKTSKIVLLYKF